MHSRLFLLKPPRIITPKMVDDMLKRLLRVRFFSKGQEKRAKKILAKMEKEKQAKMEKEKENTTGFILPYQAEETIQEFINTKIP